MQNQSSDTNASIIIPLDKISKYYQYTGLAKKQYLFVDLREISYSKFKTTYGTYSSQALIKLLQLIQQNSAQFLQILAFNTNLQKYNKKQFIINKLLRQHSYFNFFDLLNELDYIRNQLKDKELYQQMIDFIKSLLEKVKYLLQKHCETLIVVQGQCLNFYIRKTIKKNKKYLISNDCEGAANSQNIKNLLTDDDYQYSLVIGIDTVSISFCSSNQFCQSIMHNLLVNLKKTCQKHGYDIDDREFSMEMIEIADDNFFDNQSLSSFFKETYEKKQFQAFQRVRQLNMSESFYSNLIFNSLITYSQDTYYLIEGAIVFLTNLVFQKKQLKNLAYDEQYISMKHPQKQQPIGQSFINLYCQHFEGIPFQLYKNNSSCPYCSEVVIVDQTKCFERNRNIFQNLLAKNYLNPLRNDVLYYFKQKIFCLANQARFAHYPHFCQFFKARNFIRDRPEVLMILNHEKISLYSKLWGKKKLFCADQLIQTPVRGKYCRHWEFFQLMRVYEQFIKKPKGQTSFDCFICTQPIEYSELMYLHEVKLLIDLARYNFFPAIEQVEISIYLQIDHGDEIVELCTELEKGYMKKSYRLPIYETLMDPLSKSQKKSLKQNKEGQDASQFEYTEEFSNFFF